MIINLSDKEKIREYVYKEIAKDDCILISFSAYITESVGCYAVNIDIDEAVLYFIDVAGIDPVFDSMYRVMVEQTFDFISFHLPCIEQDSWH